MEASKAKNKIQEQANFALENLYEKILEDLEIAEALNSPDAKRWK